MPQENKERYTPGPWQVIENYIVDSREDLTIAEVYPSAQIDANIRLIAEAPAMFALLKEYLEQHTGLDGDFHCPCYQCKEARAIVVRVLGEG